MSPETRAEEQVEKWPKYGTQKNPRIETGELLEAIGISRSTLTLFREREPFKALFDADGDNWEKAPKGKSVRTYSQKLKEQIQAIFKNAKIGFYIDNTGKWVSDKVSLKFLRSAWPSICQETLHELEVKGVLDTLHLKLDQDWGAPTNWRLLKRLREIKTALITSVNDSETSDQLPLNDQEKAELSLKEVGRITGCASETTRYFLNLLGIQTVVTRRGNVAIRAAEKHAEQVGACVTTCRLIEAQGFIDPEPEDGKLTVLVLKDSPGKHSPNHEFEIVDLCAAGDQSRRFMLPNAIEYAGTTYRRLMTAVKAGYIKPVKIFARARGGALLFSGQQLDTWRTECAPRRNVARSGWGFIGVICKALGLKSRIERREASEQAREWARIGLLPSEEIWTEELKKIPVRGQEAPREMKCLRKRTRYPIEELTVLWNLSTDDDVLFVQNLLKNGHQEPAKEVNKKLADRGLGLIRRLRVLREAGAVPTKVGNKHIYFLGNGPRKPRSQRKYKTALLWLKKKLMEGPMLLAAAHRKFLPKSAKRKYDPLILKAYNMLKCRKHFVREFGPLIVTCGRGSRGGTFPSFLLLPGQDPPTDEHAQLAIEEFRRAVANDQADRDANEGSGVPQDANRTQQSPRGPYKSKQIARILRLIQRYQKRGFGLTDCFNETAVQMDMTAAAVKRTYYRNV